MTKKDSRKKSEDVESPFRELRGDRSLGDMARALGILPADYSRLERSPQGLRYAVLLAKTAKFAGRSMASLKLHKLETPRVSKAGKD